MFKWLRNIFDYMITGGNDEWVDPWTLDKLDILGVIIEDSSCLADCVIITPSEDDVRLAAYYLWLSDVEAHMPDRGSDYYWFKAQFKLIEDLSVSFSTAD